MPNMRKGGGKHAFTLIELVVVMLIMSILAGVAVPRFSQSLSRYRARAAAKRIASDLNYARQAAINQGAEQTVFVNTSTNSYSIPNAVDPNSSSLGYSVDLSSTAYPAKIVAADFGGFANVTYDIYGQPRSAGNIIVESGGLQQLIQLNAVTGYAAVQ